eukprot:CAMPEP_0201688614 /NCGR_PEP_ID=MMETSP0578-20130828/2342_1 /ASSEMBLY_ACC=CAM_ASM_000663 /TAXON_ID=267565 /ORGANISM="Skeletonema grethea, Strain CCMP 1804" /LENGTH=152 /DNA_ID=CAMNT_0048172989 /DNA_START=96 /DNA_END=552 /DNA_ORIENTATION=+
MLIKKLKEASSFEGFPPLTQVPQQGSPVWAQIGHPPVGGEGGELVGGFVGVGAGGSPPPEHDAQKQVLPLPQPLLTPGEEHSPLGSEPSMQIFDSEGLLLEQTYLSTDALVGGGVGGEVGLTGAGVGGGVGGFDGTGVGGGVGALEGGGVGG